MVLRDLRNLRHLLYFNYPKETDRQLSLFALLSIRYQFSLVFYLKSKAYFQEKTCNRNFSHENLRNEII